MHSDLVSVIIPAYNAEKHILECVNSVLNQSYKNIEVIVVNDGSEDKTELALESLTDPRLTIINQDNRGASFAKNTGLQKARGNFIQYLDSDDLLSSDKIELQLNTLKSKTNSIAVCKTVVFEKEIKQGKAEINTDIISGVHSGLNFYKNLLGAKGNYAMVQPNAYLIPIEIIKKAGPWSTEFYPCPDEDGEYFSRILLSSNFVVFTAGINYYRRDQNYNSLSRTYSFDRAVNQLKSTERKCINLIEVENNPQTRELLLLNISQVVSQFGSEYPEIISLAQDIISKWGFKKFRILKNTKFNLLSAIFGIRKTIGIQKVYQQIKKRII
jgi:glycosyltransferase involved in cell wall biosynthesis